jgi:sulfoxide reductase heme-binding subunit YedZ
LALWNPVVSPSLKANPMQRRLARRLIRHHAALALLSAASVAGLYFTRSYSDWVMRLSFSTAYPAMLLLTWTLLIGPWNVVRGRGNPVSSDLRRDVGIWTGVLAIAHTAVGQCVHLRGRPWLYYVYGPWERHHWFPLRHDVFGFANYTGAASVLLVAALLATSNDISLRRLGAPGWKRLQRWNYAVFALAAAHAMGYLLGIEKQKWPLVLVIAGTIGETAAMQAAGFALRRHHAKTATRKSAN